MRNLINVLTLMTASTLLISCDKIQTENKSEVCAKADTYETIKKIVFENAISTNNENPVKINDWQKEFSVTISMPVLTGYDKELAKTSCSGRLVFSVPENERKFFNGNAEIKGDITYSVQPSADKSGDIVNAQGVNFLIKDIVSANGRAVGMQTAEIVDAQNAAEEAKAAELAKIGGPQLTQTYNPSFDCGQKLNNTERMICQSEYLSSSDRELSSLFKEKISYYSGAQKQKLLAMQRANLVRRAQCADTSCVEAWYENNRNWVLSLN